MIAESRLVVASGMVIETSILVSSIAVAENEFVSVSDAVGKIPAVVCSSVDVNVDVSSF